MKEYQDFLNGKKLRFKMSGFALQESDLNPMLFPFQRHIVKHALKKGRFAIFADCGMGKTPMQLEWAFQVAKQEIGKVLILCPLAVSAQTIQEGKKFGYDVRSILSCETSSDGIYIANYEQLENVTASNFAGIVLDESSILKNFDGKTKEKIISAFAGTKYKLACTATPSPNDPMELGNHSEFLNVMGRNEMLSMYFVHDGGDTSKWRVKGHAVEKFYEFVSEWAIMLSKPSDIGFEDVGYDLPELLIHEKYIETEKRDNGLLFNDISVNATQFNRELRLTKIERISEAAEIANSSKEPFLIWIKQNEEGQELRRLIPDAVEVSGSDKDKEEKLLGFAKGNFRVLITKPRIAQFGLNYQNCPNQIFASLDFSFESLYQSIRRSYRFGQTRNVNIFLLTTDTMQNVKTSIRNKQIAFDEMRVSLSKISSKKMEVEKTMEVEKKMCDPIITPDYQIFHGDCVPLCAGLADESIGLSIFSPPFAELYTYSDENADMGNSADYKQFLTAFGFLVKDLFRVMKTGRNVCVHCMDLPIQKGKEGVMGLRDFSGMIRDSFEGAGFILHDKIVIWKDPVVEMQRTKAHGLLHKTTKSDASRSRTGTPDQILVFKKWGNGEFLDPVKLEISVDTWQKWASPVWMDINYGNTLNARTGREEKDEKHICPLQLDTIERLVALNSNAGDTVLDPFLGIGSTIWQALKMNRKGVGFELKKSYFLQSKKNLSDADALKKQGKLF